MDDELRLLTLVVTGALACETAADSVENVEVRLPTVVLIGVVNCEMVDGAE